MNTKQLSTVGECARRWGLCEATVRNAVRRLFGNDLPRVGRTRVLTEAQAEVLREDLVKRGLEPIR
jgi:hypothetical protein